MIPLLALLACHRAPEPADLVLTGGPVYTMAGSVAEGVAIRDGVIVAVGTAEEVAAYAGAGTTEVSLAGHALFPGFIDAHTHPAWSGTELRDVDLYEATTVQELLDAISAWAAASPDAPWIRGGGWDVSRFNDSLNHGQLDAITGDRPAILASADAHSAWVNALALAAAGITADTPDPEGGIIERDTDGAPTGVLRETAADLVWDILPEWDEAQIDGGLQDALTEASSYGLTGLVDANAWDAMLAGYARAEAKGTLTARIWAAGEVTPGEDPVPMLDDLRTTYAGDRLQLTQGKLYLDGVIESETATMLEPYEDGTNGEALYTDAEVLDAITALDDAGYQIHAHAIGDGAVRQILDGLDALEAARGPADRRPLLAHLEVVDPADWDRFAGLDATADIQMLWAYPDPYIVDWTIPYIGETRAAWLYPFAGLADAGARLAAGSDWSVTTMNPWEAIEVAVTRQDPYEGGDPLNAEQAISLWAALGAYTREAAIAIHEEDRLGTLEVGKAADLVWVDRDPFAIPVEDLSDVQVLGTWVDGARVYPGDGTARRARRARRDPHGR